MLGVLWATLPYATRHGDWRGHLTAWWAVATGEVTTETRAEGRHLPARRETVRWSGTNSQAGAERR